jgi:hypothetical protein
LGVKRTASIGNGGRNPPKRNFVKLGNRKQKVKHEHWKRVQRNNKRAFTELSKWLDKSSKELKAMSAYLLESKWKSIVSFSRLTRRMWLRTEQKAVRI